MSYSSYYVVVRPVFCVSCGHKEARYALDMAEKRMWDEPDSALKVLESIVMPEDLEGKELADYALLLTQAQYRSNIVATSDSLINIAVGYYQDKDVEKERPHYYIKEEY